VLVSEDAVREANSVGGVRFEVMGLAELKGLARPVVLHRALATGDPA
jgi:hypothetical protein